MAKVYLKEVPRTDDGACQAGEVLCHFSQKACGKFHCNFLEESPSKIIYEKVEERDLSANQLDNARPIRRWE